MDKEKINSVAINCFAYAKGFNYGWKAAYHNEYFSIEKIAQAIEEECVEKEDSIFDWEYGFMDGFKSSGQND